MLSLQPPSSSFAASKTTPHLLPARTNHTGAVDACERYWKPVADAEGQKTAYLRGRRLLGREVKLPETHRGVLARTTEKTVKLGELRPREDNGGDVPMQDGEEDEDEDEDMDMSREAEEEQKVKILEEVGTFDEVVLWGHEVMPADDDQFVRGMEEWVGFAGAIHSYDDQSESK